MPSFATFSLTSRNVAIYPRESNAQTGAFRLAGRIQIRILAHLPLHFLALFFVIEQNLAVAEVAAFDFALRFVEERFEAGDRAAAGEIARRAP